MRPDVGGEKLEVLPEAALHRVLGGEPRGHAAVESLVQVKAIQPKATDEASLGVHLDQKRLEV